jgi:hypothetical protein
VVALLIAVYENGGTVPDAVRTPATTLLVVFIVPSPIYFTVLCWNNVDWHVMTLLSQQSQFRVVGGLSLWIIVMNAWRQVDRKDDSVLFEIGLSIPFWSPLLMILFMDAIKRQSKLFKVAMPAAYLMYVMVTYIYFGYIQSPTPIIPDTNSTDWSQRKLASTGATFESQIASALSTIMFVMLSFVYNALYDRSGTAVLFPIRFATVLKNAVPFILKAGTWMRTELDEDGQRIVLLSKRTATVEGDADDEDSVQLETNLGSRTYAPAAPQESIVHSILTAPL